MSAGMSSNCYINDCPGERKAENLSNKEPVRIHLTCLAASSVSTVFLLNVNYIQEPDQQFISGMSFKNKTWYIGPIALSPLLVSNTLFFYLLICFTSLEISWAGRSDLGNMTKKGFIIGIRTCLKSSFHNYFLPILTDASWDWFSECMLSVYQGETYFKLK